MLYYAFVCENASPFNIVTFLRVGIIDSNQNHNHDKQSHSSTECFSSVAEVFFAGQHTSPDRHPLVFELATLRVHILGDAGSDHQVLLGLG